MEIGQQQIDRTEAVAGQDEQPGLAGKLAQLSDLGGGAFEEAQARRADRDDAAAPATRRVDPAGCLGADQPPFGVHAVLARIL